MPDASFAYIAVRSTVGSNIFLFALKDGVAGRLELYYSSTGETKIYKKGYTGDWALVE